MNAVRTMLDGRYQLGEVLGRGGMSTVYRATDTVLGRTVAIKVLSPALADGDSVWVARFAREARAAAGLSHPGVSTIYDTGLEDGTRFIVMECVPGESLAEILRDKAPLETGRAVNVAAQVADVLAAAHAAGIIHRDVKPGNVMLTPDGRVKVLDFGIARSADSTSITQTMSVLGTAAYMAPEQAAGEVADARSDIYSLGCVLYAMLAGAPPFTGEQAAAVLHQHVNVPPRPLSEVAPGVPPALSGLVGQMLAKSPEARPQSAAEVRDRLQSLLDPTAPTIPVKAAAAALAAGAGAAGGAGGAIAAGARAAGARRPARSRQPLSPRTARTQRIGRPQRSASAGRGLALAAIAGLLLVIAAIAITSSGGGGNADNPINSTTTQRHTGTTQKPPATSSTVQSTTSTTPPTTTTPPGPAAGQPQGPQGGPPGKAKKHDHGKGGGGGGDGGGD